MAEEKTQAPPKKCKKTESQGGAPAWMVTYSDLVTLLLTFFVLLVSMANMDPVRFTAASSSIKDAFGTNKESASVDFAIPVLPSSPITKYSPIQIQTTKKLYEKIKSQIDALRLNKDIGVMKKDDDSIVLRINDSILFERGQVKISKNAYPILRNIADIVRPLPVDLRIEGHTDDIPVQNSQFDNWDLSVERAASVMKYLSHSGLFDLDRMSAVGYGKDRPVVPNKDEASRAQNRRVDFVLKLQSNRLLIKKSGKDGTVPL